MLLDTSVGKISANAAMRCMISTTSNEVLRDFRSIEESCSLLKATPNPAKWKNYRKDKGSENTVSILLEEGEIEMRTDRYGINRLDPQPQLDL